jgi:hypothetical protein
LLEGQENVNDKLVRNVLESLLVVADAALWMLFKSLVFWVELVELVGNGATDHVSDDLFESLFIRVIVDLLQAALVSLMGSFLPHLPNLLVDSLDSHRLDLTDRNAINGLLVLLNLTLGLLHALTCHHLLVGEVAGLARFVEPGFEALVLALGDVVVRDVQSRVGHVKLVLDALKLFLLHLLGDRSAHILRFVLIFLGLLLDLNLGGLIVDPSKPC